LIVHPLVAGPGGDHAWMFRRGWRQYFCPHRRTAGRDDTVGFAPDDQRRRRNTVDVLFQAFVGLVMAK
jgi:hypothetical protein